MGERKLQRRGFAAAFRHPDVLSVLGSGITGRIAVTYVEWAGPDEQWVIVPWAIIDDAADAAAFAGVLSAAPPVSGNQTSMSFALAFAAAQFRSLDTPVIRRTIDISGDGPNSAGPQIASARDFVLELGITINGLTFASDAGYDPGPYAYLTDRDQIDLESYYQDCVIGGAGGFAMHVGKTADFIEVIRRKVAFEIAALPLDVRYADYSPPSDRSANCATPEQGP